MFLDFMQCRPRVPHLLTGLSSGCTSRLKQQSEESESAAVGGSRGGIRRLVSVHTHSLPPETPRSAQNLSSRTDKPAPSTPALCTLLPVQQLSVQFLN